MSAPAGPVDGASPRPFGRSGPGLLRRLRPARIDPADLREVAGEVLPALAGRGLRTAVLDRCGAGSVLALDEAERRVRVPLAELADDMTAAGVPATPDGIAAALTSWVAHRPVPDGVAAAAGVAVLDWADARRRGLAWRVVVRRDDVAVAWTPSPRADPASVVRTRAAAGERAARLAVDLRVEGPIALWSHPVPVLASAVLAAPGRVAAELTSAGLRPDGAHAVVTPHRPVACAAPAVAARLAGETPEDCVTLPCAALAGLPWG